MARDELSAANQAMLKRGPDGGDIWLSDDGRIGLSHRRLAIIDLTDDAIQPMAIEGRDGTPNKYRISYNGEIYNFNALRDELIQQGVSFHSHSDTEVLLRLYERDGAEMVRKLRGMFAFALWDESRRGLLLARDPFGIKPLYYADDGKSIRVASQVKALLAGGQIDTAPDPAGHAGFFLFGNVPEPHTLYQSIKALPAGHTLWVEQGGRRKQNSFFDLAGLLSTPAAATGQSPNLGDALRRSVADHLVADVPVGLFLSSGLDSATLTALASEHADARLDTITLGFEEFQGLAQDEVPLAEQIAQAYGTHQHTERIGKADFDAALPDILSAMDQPTIDGVNTYFVARAAKNAGLKVAISGLGGDELFGGYDTFGQVPKMVSGLGWMKHLGALGKTFRIVSAPLIKRMTSPKYAGVLELGPTYGGAYLLRRGLYMPWELADILGPDMAREGWKSLQPILRMNALHEGITEPARKVAALEMHWYMRNQLLRDADWAGMAHSVEIRTPLVDSVLFETLAPALGRPGGPDKQQMARTPAKPLPEAVLNRPKSGFFVPVQQWIREATDDPKDRGYRGWARRVYASHTA